MNTRKRKAFILYYIYVSFAVFSKVSLEVFHTESVTTFEFHKSKDYLYLWYTVQLVRLKNFSYCAFFQANTSP